MTLKVTVVGAGAIGGLLAAGLSRGDCEVSVLARGATLAAIRAHGLRVIAGSSEMSDTRYPMRAADDAAQLCEQDVVVLALKAQLLPDLAPALRPLVGAHTTLLAAMNGIPWWFLHDFEGPLKGQTLESVDPGGVVSRALPPAQAASCVVHLAASTEAPGVVRRGRGNQLILGASEAGPATRRGAHLAHLAEIWRAAGIEVTLSEEIRRDIWVKLWGNMNMNPISALTGATADKILDDPYTHGLVLRMMDEAVAVGTRLGLDTGMSAAERSVITRKLGAFKTSMLQDVEAGRPIELDPILGVFPELGRKLGVPTPHCDAVYGLLRQREAIKHAPG